VLGRMRSSGGWHRAILLSMALAATLALAACGSTKPGTTAGGTPGANVGGSAGGGGTLTIANTEPPGDLNPLISTNDGAQVMYSDLAYEPLIYVDAKTNSYQPGLALKWNYVEDGGAFVMHLRPNVQFSDGEKLTAQAVVASLKAVKTLHGGLAVYAAVMKRIEATGPLTVKITLTGHDPDLPLLLSQTMMGPDVVSPKALKNDLKGLSTKTVGTGPYMLDPKQTVTGSTYTYVPNPNYYDKSKVHYKKVVLQVIANLSSQLNALRTGQVRFAWGSASTIPQAKAAGLKVYSGPSSWVGALLFDRDGVLAKPLANLKVRQALNYAINRKANAETIYGKGLAEPVAQPQVRGYSGFVESLNNYYPYDPAKAKQLLKEAGYPNGFDLTVGATTNEYVGSASMANALAQDWDAIGVKVHIKSYATVNQLVTPWINAKLPVTAGGYNGLPMYTQVQQTLTKDAGLFNPFKSTDPALTKLMKAAEDAPTPEASTAALEAIQKWVVENAWFAPVANSHVIYYADPKLKGVAVSPLAYNANPVGWSG
jgi:peptide/nickel transport system substrate-binding protein